MNTTMPYILKDLSGNIWNFFVDKNSHLICDNSYENIQIDENVMEFDVNINYLGTIQLIYITYDGHIKYCQFNKKWDTEILYTLSQSGDKIKDINLYSIDDELHIFFLFNDSHIENNYSLLHYKWHGKKFDTNVVCSITPLPYALKNYCVELNQDKIIITFINLEENEIVLNLCEYANSSWKTPCKLYRLNGDNLNFSTVNYNNFLHILNLSRENDAYFLEHVTIDSKGNMTNFKIRESNKVIYNPILLIQNNILYSLWMENNELMYCSYNNGWHNIINLSTEGEKIVKPFRYICEENPWDNVKATSVFASDSPNTKIFLPEKIFYYHNNYKENYDTLSTNSDKDSTIQKLLKELSYNKMLKSNLEKRISILTNKIFDKNLTINKHNKYINKIIIEKKKIETEYNSLLQSQNNYIEEIQNLKRKFKALANENEILKEKGIAVKEFESNFHEQKKTLENMYSKMKYLELKLQEKENETNNIKKELEVEKSKGFIKKLFK